jgi:hypothetical protein
MFRYGLQVWRAPSERAEYTGLATSAAYARSFWITGPGQGEIRTAELARPAAGDVVVRTLYTAVSRGTEMLVFGGRVPRSEYARMRAPHQEGEFPAPLKYGYISVGRVEQGPRGLLGRDVFCLYPHQTRYVVPQRDVVTLPAAVPPGRAVLAANLETALNGVWDAELAAGSRLGIVGAGAVGLLAGWVARTMLDADVEIVDINPARAAIAAALGLGFATVERARTGAATILHTSGSAAGLRTALELAGFEATIIELSWHGDAEVPLPLGAAFHSQRLTLRSSQVGTVARAERATVSTRARLERCLAMLTEPALDVLITGESPFDELPELMPRLAADSAATICHRIGYDKA